MHPTLDQEFPRQMLQRSSASHTVTVYISCRNQRIHGYRQGDLWCHTDAGCIQAYLLLLKNNIKPSKYEALIGPIKAFMNLGSIPSSKEKGILNVVQNGRFLYEKVWGKGAIKERKERIMYLFILKVPKLLNKRPKGLIRCLGERTS